MSTFLSNFLIIIWFFFRPEYLVQQDDVVLQFINEIFYSILSLQGYVLLFFYFLNSQTLIDFFDKYFHKKIKS
jgi:uncharacterized membrane protein (DUF106 family)